MRLKYIIIFIASSLSLAATAQEKCPVNFGKVKAEDFTISSTLIDGNSNAVIIADVGSVKFEGNTKGWFSFIYKRDCRIKILNKKAFDLSVVSIPLYISGNNSEKLFKVRTASYILKDDKVFTTESEENDIYQQKYDDNHNVVKFTIPGVVEGAIIEYSYSIKSDFEFNLPSWNFQSINAPVLWSEYSVSIPEMLTYVMASQGENQFYIKESSEGFGTFSISQNRSYMAKPIGMAGKDQFMSVSTTINNHRWVKKNIPEFPQEEDYIYSASNFIDKISFQLSKTYDGESYQNYMSDWKIFKDQLLARNDFGVPVQQSNEWLDGLLNRIVSSEDSKLIMAQKIYSYIRDNFKCTNVNALFLQKKLSEIEKDKYGSVSDINLLLLAMLRRKQIQSFPVVLSTRNFVRCPMEYPVLDRFNYVVCSVNVDGENYFIDATSPFLPFGKLQLKCYNGYARVMSEDTTVVNLSPDLLKETEFVNVNIQKGVDNSLEGYSINKKGFFKSLRVREDIFNSSLDNYTEAYKTTFPGEVKILSIKIDSLASVQSNLAINTNFSINLFNGADVVYFNPMIGYGYKLNPFNNPVRNYPVELPYKQNEVFVFSMEIPDNYTIEELPKPQKLVLNENEGFFEYLISISNNVIQIRTKLSINKPFFAKEDYQNLRDFYSLIVKKNAESIVFKKTK